MTLVYAYLNRRHSPFGDGDLTNGNTLQAFEFGLGEALREAPLLDVLIAEAHFQHAIVIHAISSYIYLRGCVRRIFASVRSERRSTLAEVFRPVKASPAANQ